MARKQRSDSVAGQINTFAQLGTSIAPPKGITLDTEEEKVIWEQFSSARAPDAWRDLDLVMLSKIVKIEARIRKHQLELEEMGAVIYNQRGTPIENPMFRVIDTLTRQQTTVIRSLSLNQTAQHPKVLNATGEKARAAQKVLESLDDDLIPRLRAVQ